MYVLCIMYYVLYMDVWMYGWMDVCMHGCMDVCTHGCMDAWMYCIVLSGMVLYCMYYIPVATL